MWAMWTMWIGSSDVSGLGATGQTDPKCRRMRFQEIQEACWTGYRQAGMKKKGDRQVPNCVPVEEVKIGPEITGRDLLFKAAAMAMRDASHEGISWTMNRPYDKPAGLWHTLPTQ
jgi:hypothetical protein